MAKYMRYCRGAELRQGNSKKIKDLGMRKISTHMLLRLVCSFLTKNQIAKSDHPLNSPDFVPCYVWLFANIKTTIK